MIDEKKLIEESTWYPDKLFAASASDHYRNGWNDCNRDWLKRFKELSLETKTSDWIPVTERLPEVWKSVLVTSGHLRVRDIRIAFVNENMEWCSIWSSCEPDILAWMPLPEPYKGDEK